jgi:hypothetical protein
MATVPWWKRLLLSLISLVAGCILGDVLMVLQMAISNSAHRFTPLGLLLAFAFFAPFFLISSFLGWVIAIPVVLALRNFNGWRFWVYLALGVLIGPVLWLALDAYSLVTNPRSQFDLTSMPYVVAVSFLTTLFYLLAMRWAQAGARRTRLLQEPALRG